MWLTLQYGMIFQTLEFPIKPKFCSAFCALILLLNLLLNSNFAQQNFAGGDVARLGGSVRVPG